jgi:DNA-directed RNA polymerase subunit RPC12/RpoP
VQCYYCSQLILLSQIRNHIETFHGGFRRLNPFMYGEPRPFQCPVCSGAFKTQERVENHRCYHVPKPVKSLDGKRYLCPECNAEFDRIGNYRNHMNR